MSDKITGPLFKWFGSKWTSSKHYPIPTQDVIIEPFAGGAGYSLRHHDKQVMLAESNEHIFRLWRWLIHEAKESDIREIPIGLPEGTDVRQIGLSEGQCLLIKNWQRTNNVGNCWTISPWGNKPGQWTENTRNRVAEEFHLIKHWKICSDGISLIDSYKETPVTWFVDPPYQFNYQYRTTVPIQYDELACQLKQTKGQLIVCEAMCTKTGNTPDWLPFEQFRQTVTSRRKSNNNHHSRELLFYTERP
jgi:site-specific DNA-adenine methylase